MSEIRLIFAGASLAALNASVLAYAADLNNSSHDSAGNPPAPSTPTSSATAPAAPSSPAPTPPAAPSQPEASGAGGENAGKVDAAGTVFDPARHTGTIVKSGLWRMKTGLARGPGEGEDSPTYRKPGEAAPAAAGNPPPPPPPTPPAPPAPPADPNRPTDAGHRHDNGNGTEQWFVNGAWDGGKHPIPAAAPAPAEDDEFAAFATAAGAQSGTAPARSWTDADLSKLCNQGAVSDGNPERVKAIIAKFVPAGEVPHSRNVPADQREAFAREIEQTLGITYAG